MHATPVCVTVKVCPAMPIVPVRDSELAFAPTEKFTVPLPVPLLTVVIHASPVVAVHAQAAGAVTLKLPVPPVEVSAWLVGFNKYVQATPVCVTVKVCPATPIVPVRDNELVFAATTKFTTPLPEPLLVVVIHASPVAALHAQPIVAFTLNVPVPPLDVKAWLAGLIEYVQPAAFWFTVNVCPPTVIVPLRAVPAGLAPKV